MRDVHDRRGKAVDRLLQALMEIDMLTSRFDVLLDRRNTERPRRKAP